MRTGRRLNPGFRLRGATSRTVSIVYVVLSAQWVFAASMEFGEPPPSHRASATSILALCLAVAVLARLTVETESSRDRAIVCLGLSGFAVALVCRLGQGWGPAVISGARALDLGMSIAAVAISFSLLYSALRAHRM
jgi:hypothetical protein